jgi:mxaL protein
VKPLRELWAAWRADRERISLALAALALAATFLHPGMRLARPRFEHVVVLDVTQSMNVTDALIDGRPVSRLAYAKYALHIALDSLPCGSKLGWGIFTEYRSYLLFTPVEVCTNRAELRSTLAGIDGRMAWSGNSEIAKGLHSAILAAKSLPGVPSLVFVTDGHEAPPLNPRYRPVFDDKPGEVAGLIVGVGEATLQPIPKTDALGRPLGVWAADEVLQVDPRSQGRGASVDREALVDEDAPLAGVGLGATPGSEHLSSLREPYLELLASEHEFGFLHLRDPKALAEALRAPALARSVVVRVDARLALAALAFVLLLAPHLAAWWRRTRVGARGRAG